MTNQALLAQLKAVRMAVAALGQQVDGIAAAVAGSRSDGPCEHPQKARMDAADFDDPGRTVCRECGVVIPGQTRVVPDPATAGKEE